MNEIIIDDKKYVSSKRAAQITGYAKDYVGQLCREGRVPARLVGRSWYVLESAIQDHRFGVPAQEESKTLDNEPRKLGTWEEPKYEAAEAKILPSINKIREEAIEAIAESSVQKEEDFAPQEALEPWGEWFATRNIAPREPMEEVAAAEPVHGEAPEHRSEQFQEEIEIPVHQVVVPQPAENTAYEAMPVPQTRSRSYAMPIRLGMFAAAAVAVFVAALGAGYADNIANTSSQFASVAGISIYNSK